MVRTYFHHLNLENWSRCFPRHQFGTPIFSGVTSSSVTCLFRFSGSFVVWSEDSSLVTDSFIDFYLLHFKSFQSISSLFKNIFKIIGSNPVLRKFSPFLDVFLVLCNSTRSPFLISVLVIPLS